MKLINPKTFQELLKASTSSTRVVPVDCTWYLPNLQKLGLDTFKKSRIPGSIFLDIDEVKDKQSIYPHMLPKPAEFCDAVSKLGLKSTDALVFYDQIGNFSAPRGYWMFEVFNHKNIYLLDNFNTYKQVGLPIDTTPVKDMSSLGSSVYTLPESLSLDKCVSFEQMQEIIDNDSYQIIDARPKGRFDGTDPEPRPGLSSGHVKGAINIAAVDVLDPTTKQFLPKERLQELTAKVDEKKQIIVMCGTGVTACVTKTALELAGFENLKVYDGSWTEYAQRLPDKVVKT